MENYRHVMRSAQYHSSPQDGGVVQRPFPSMGSIWLYSFTLIGATYSYCDTNGLSFHNFYFIYMLNSDGLKRVDNGLM